MFQTVFTFAHEFCRVVSWATLLYYIGNGSFSVFISSYSKLDQISDQLKFYTEENYDVFDFIIVGAGSAGCVVANRLSENEKHKVLLVEAFGEPNPYTFVPGLALLLLNRPELDWQFYTVPQDNSCQAMYNKQCYVPRGKGLGGSSLLNFLLYVRGHPYDYDNWANITEDDSWSFKSVLPWFKKSEDYDAIFYDSKIHSKGGYLKIREWPYDQSGIGNHFLDAAKEFGYKITDLNGYYSEGFSPVVSTQEYGQRWSTARGFLDPIRNRANLFIYKYAYVTKILLRGTSNEAYGIEYVRHGKKQIAYASNEIILSAGAIKSPQLLMLSGIGPKDHLTSLNITVKVDSPVGLNFQDHISTPIGPFIINQSISILGDRDHNTNSILNYSLRGNGVFSTIGVPVYGFVSVDEDKKEWPNIQYLPLEYGIQSSIVQDFEHTFNIRKDILDEYYDPLKGKDAFHLIISLGRPKSRGWIKLASSNPFDPVLINPNYFDVEEDLENLLKGIKVAIKIIQTSNSFKQINATLPNFHFPPCKMYTLHSDDYWKCYAQSFSLTVYHQSGSCSMGPSYSGTSSISSVVDSELKAIGTKQLRIIDASVMPTIPVGNINAPTIMVAEKGASLIIEHWRNVELEKLSKFFL